MKLETIKIPILLAVFLPGIGFFIADDNYATTVPLVYKWAYTSGSLFLLWNLLATSWRFENSYKQIVYLSISTPIFLVIASYISFSLGLKENSDFDVKELIRTAFLLLILLIIQYNRESQRKLDQLRIEKEQLSKENYKAQLQSLRRQIDPHFLFNSLNTLRSMVRQKHNNSENFVLNLSEFYRSTLNHHEKNTLALSEELSFLNSYLNLMKSRNEKAVQFDISEIDEKYKLHSLPSFALQNVVENCFKHNSMSSNKPLQIKIVSTSNGYIEISNNIQEKLTQISTTGTGLSLLKTRYKLLGENKGVVISKFDDIFQIKLKLINPDSEYINS